MKRSNKNRRFPPAYLVVFITFATVFMYLVAVSVSTPENNPTAFLTATGNSTLFFFLLVLLATPAIVDEFHRAIMDWEEREDALQQKKADREHYYAHRRRMRALAEKREQHRYRYPAYTYRPRRASVRQLHIHRHQRNSDLRDNGC